jgi:hypothetical protein
VTGLGSPNFQIIAETMLLDSSTDMAFSYLGAAGRYVSAEHIDSGAVSLALSIAALCVSALCLLAAAYSRSSPNQHNTSRDNSSHDNSSAPDESQQGEQRQASINPLRSSGDKYGYAKI